MNLGSAIYADKPIASDRAHAHNRLLTPHCSVLLQVTEEMLATLFQECGTVMDCRICGDPNSAMRFAFVEFLEDHAAQQVRQHGQSQAHCQGRAGVPAPHHVQLVQHPADT
jgi:hypothetical protein